MATPQRHNFFCESLFHNLINRITHPTERHTITDEKDDSQDSSRIWPYLLDENRSDYNNKKALQSLDWHHLSKWRGTKDVIYNDSGS